VVFVVGAASLGTEIAAARLLAPYFGASTIVWATTIATVLLALSVGYWLGGRIADRYPSLDGLCRVVSATRLAYARSTLPVALAPLATATATRLAPAAAGGTLLTDDRAPVEWMIDRSIIRYAAHGR
jgi:MFS family permease